MKHFPIERKYAELLEAMGIYTEELLKKAMLPKDLFSHKTPTLTDLEYFRFMTAIGELAPDEDTPIKLATLEGIETFSPPIFAAYCSKNAKTCIERLAEYKALIGAIVYEVQEENESLSVEFKAVNEELELPEIIVEFEFLFLVNLIRKATKVNIIPKAVIIKYPVKNPKYEEFLKTSFTIGNKNKIVFSKADGEIPFISRNDSMWGFFQPELRKRLSYMEIDESFSAKVRNALVELLPSGECGIENLAKELALSKRTLQRKLKEEDTTFQKQLNHTRELLAKHYIKNTNMSTEDMAYLLGYQDLNSFFRAFVAWTGTTISEYKKGINILEN